MLTSAFILLSNSWNDYKGLIVLLFLGIGFIQCFYGYRFFKFIMAVVGFFVGAAIGLAVGGVVGRDMVSSVIGALIGGIIFSNLAILFYYLSVFVTGALVGAVGVALLSLLFHSTPEVAVIIIAAIIGGILALYFQKLIIILGTSFNGAYILVSGFYLLMMEPEKFSFIYSMNERAIKYYDLQTTVFIFVSLAIIVAIIGVFFQYGKFSNVQERIDNGSFWSSLKITKDDLQENDNEIKEQFGRNKDKRRITVK